MSCKVQVCDDDVFNRLGLNANRPQSVLNVMVRVPYCVNLVNVVSHGLIMSSNR